MVKIYDRPWQEVYIKGEQFWINLEILVLGPVSLRLIPMLRDKKNLELI